MPDQRRAVLYARVSKLQRGDNGDTKSVRQQLDILRDLAEREHVTIVEEYRDDGISASQYARGKARTGWEATMDIVESGRVDELWTWELSRATRDRPVWARLIGACMAHDVSITINGRVHDPNDPDDAFMLDLSAALAVKESASTSRRIRRDVKDRAVLGLPHGKVPYGYRRVYDPNTGALLRQEPDPETAPVVRELARRVLAGEALYRLAIEMNQRGVPSPETIRRRRMGDTGAYYEWRTDQVRDVVASPTAAGLRIHQGKVLEGVMASWEPIVSMPDYKSLQQLFADPRRRTNPDPSARHLLTGLAVCGKCGGIIRRIKNRGVPSYACTGLAGFDGASRFCVSRKIVNVDAYIEEVLIGRLSRPDAVAALSTTEQDDTDQILAQLTGLRAEHSELIGMAERREISTVAFARLEAALLGRIADAEAQLASTSVSPLVASLVGADVEQRWADLALEQKRQVIRSLMEIRIHPVGRATRTFQPDSIEIVWQV